MKLIYPILPGGRFKALTLSFDDGRVQDRRLIALLNRCGIKATFNLNSGEQGENRIPLCEYAPLYAGHEIAAHGVRHPGMTATPLPLSAQQVLEDRRALEHHTQAPVRGFAYPYGEVNAAVAAMLPALGIRYARTTQDTGRFDFPQDWLHWDPTCHIFNDLAYHGEKFLSRTGRRKPMLLYVWGHSYELDENNGWTLLEDFCRRLGGQADIWYATNIEIYDYRQSCARLNFLPMPTAYTTQAVVTAGCMWTGRPSALPPGRSPRCKKGENHGKPDF